MRAAVAVAVQLRVLLLREETAVPDYVEQAAAAAAGRTDQVRSVEPEVVVVTAGSR